MAFQQKKTNSNESLKRNLKGTVPLLALLTAFPALSTDMILPAIPSLAKAWNQPLSVINLILVCFFVTYGFFLLFYGPISDRFGRRRPLLFGLAVYIVASFFCAFASNVSMLILSRMLQAAGAAASSSISLAMTRDIFSGKERERILAYTAVIMALAPMLAPVIGGWILADFSWPWIFIVQALMGGIGILGVLRFPETLSLVSDAPFSRIMHAYGRLMLNPLYLVMVLIMSVKPFSSLQFHCRLFYYLCQRVRAERAKVQLLLCLQCTCNYGRLHFLPQVKKVRQLRTFNDYWFYRDFPGRNFPPCSPASTGPGALPFQCSLSRFLSA